MAKKLKVKLKNKHYDKPGNLLTETKLLLKMDERTLVELHAATGLPFHWLQSLRQGRCSNPSVNRIEFLHAFLSSCEKA